MKKVLFYFGHPAQYLFARETVREIRQDNAVIILLKTKDVLENLVKADGFDYINILPEKRGKSRLSILYSLIKRIAVIFPIVLRYRPDVMISTDASFAIVGFMLRRHVITITEDDYEVIKSLGNLTYPFTSAILCPFPCTVGKWSHKKVGYYGYMKLAYLHPKVFSLDTGVLEKYGYTDKYALIRIAALTAHHDFGIKGIDDELLGKIVRKLEEKNIRVLVSSEGDLPKEFDGLRLKIMPQDMHHILAGSSLLISDSQSMSVEAAMLGVPSIRYSSFVGRISVLEELETEYHLTFGVQAGNPDVLLSRLNMLLGIEDIKTEFLERRKLMFRDKINVSDFLTWFILNYPKSKDIVQSDPDFQLKFI